jgi:hypothetical protein
MRNLATVTIICALLTVILASNICSIEAAPFFSGIKIISPTDSTYNDGTITLNATADTIGGSNILFSMNYSLDDSISEVIPLTLQYPRNSIMIAQHNGTVVLPNLSVGEHKITVYANYTYISSSSISATESSYYNSTVYFTIKSSPNPSPTPTPTTSPTTTWLTIDLADHNYVNNVLIGQPVNFSAVLSNGLAPYEYLWKYRPYYMGTTVGDFYPTGDWIEGAATQNFTFTPNSTGSYLIEVKIWDSDGAYGMFMSLPPGIWVNAKNSTSTSTGANTTLSPSNAPSPSPTPPPSATQISSPSPSIPEFPSWITLPLLMLVAALGAILFRKKKTSTVD